MAFGTPLFSIFPTLAIDFVEFASVSPLPLVWPFASAEKVRRP